MSRIDDAMEDVSRELMKLAYSEELYGALGDLDGATQYMRARLPLPQFYEPDKHARVMAEMMNVRAQISVLKERIEALVEVSDG